MYGPMRLDWWGDERTTPDDCTSSAAECTAGEGRFFLMPLRGRDRDKDGFVTVSYLPVQLTGTGAMTRLASVTEITRVTGPNSINARALRTRSAFNYDEDDQLEDASTISTVISGTHTFQTGDVAGNPVFVAVEVGEADVDAFTVDMEWTCPSGTGVARPQGYQFRLSDIGCTGINQKMALRYTTNPKRVWLEQYGTSTVSFGKPTVTVQDGQAFVIDIGGLHVEGVLLSADAQDAEVRFDELEWKGTPVCDTGTYTFGVE